MSLPPLHHAIYTHAGGEGFRDVFLAPDWPGERRRVSRWLRSLKPDAETAYATNAFRLGGTIHACLARVEAAFAPDEHGRPGLFVHALVTPLAEDRPPGSFESALLKASEKLGDGEAEWTAYLERCRGTRTVKIPAQREKKLADELFESFLTALRHGGGIELVAAAAPRPLPHRLAAAAALLPPRLRLAGRWAVGLGSGLDVAVLARPAAGGEAPSPGPDAAARACAEWLRSRGAGEATGDWRIRSWDQLMGAVAGV